MAKTKVISCLFTLLLGTMIGCFYPSPLEHNLRYSGSFDTALSENEIGLRWLGTAGYEIRHRPAGANEETVILIDPFLTRSSIFKFAASLLFDLPLKTDRAGIHRLIERHDLALDRADYIFIAHGHYDHLLDAPYLAELGRQKAKIAGSKTTLNIARAFDIPENRLVDVECEPTTIVNDIKVTAVESKHVKLIGNHVYNAGEQMTPPIPPLNEGDFKLGREFNYLLEVDGFKIYHVGDTDLIDDNVRRQVGDVDILILGLANRNSTPDYVGRVMSLTNPEIVIPTHYDYFFQPFSWGVWVMTNARFADFVKTAQAIRPDVEIITLDFFQEYRKQLDPR